MTIEGAIIAREAAHSGLHALVDGRIYALRTPQEVDRDSLDAVKPFVVFQRIGESRDPQGTSDPPQRHTLFQFSCWAPTYGAAHDVADQVAAAFVRFNGTLDSTVIEDCLFSEKRDGEDIDTELFRVDTDLMIHWEA